MQREEASDGAANGGRAGESKLDLSIFPKVKQAERASRRVGSVTAGFM